MTPTAQPTIGPTMDTEPARIPPAETQRNADPAFVELGDEAFAHIDPLQRAVAKRRYRAVAAFLSQPKRFRGDIAAAAVAAGQNLQPFRLSVKRWQRYRDPAALLRKPRGKAQRSYVPDERAIDITRTVIREMGAGAERGAATAEADRRCRAEGVEPLSGTTVWRHLREMRASGEIEAPGSGRIIVGRLRFEMPMQDCETGFMPTLLAAVLLPERVIVAHELSTVPGETPSVHKLLERLCELRQQGAKPRPLIIRPADLEDGQHALKNADVLTVLPSIPSVQREMSRAFGDRLGMLRVLYRPLSTRTSGTKASKCVEPLTASAAVDVIEEAVEAHNAAIPHADVRFDIT